jgi:hypothetical protein
VHELHLRLGRGAAGAFLALSLFALLALDILHANLVALIFFGKSTMSC